MHTTFKASTLALSLTVSLLSVSKASTIYLGFGNVSIKVPAGVALQKKVAFESVSYYVAMRAPTTKTVLSIYLGSNYWIEPKPKIMKRTIINGFVASYIVSSSVAGISKTIILKLPKSSPDRQLVFSYDGLSGTQRRLAETIIQSVQIR